MGSSEVVEVSTGLDSCQAAIMRRFDFPSSAGSNSHHEGLDCSCAEHSSTWQSDS